MSQLIAQRDLEFLLYQVFGAAELPKYARYADYDRQSFEQILATARGIAEDYFLPHYQLADAQEPQFDGQQVITPAAVKVAWQQFAASGLLAARQPFEAGGMQLPALIHMACNAYFMAANPATAAYPFLTSAAANVIQAFGSAQQQALYLAPMLDGRCAGTMALTEPDVGSSLGDLTTKARPHSDGSYRLRGQKMYISGGDQDLTENIVHLVLARIEGAPVGVKGISMFIVPKWRVDANGQPTTRNDVRLAGLLHKMGYRGTTSTVLNFGEQDDCHGYLVGEPGQGLQYMFKMMNEARIGVGLGAAMIGYRGYLASLEYAKSRPQGRAPSNKDPASKPLMIIEHADVKRMLLQQKAWVEGSLALCLFAAKLVDEHEAGGDEDAALLLDLLTPIVKSYPSWYGPKANDLAIQVLGGAGYTRDYPVEQCYRDNRLNPIHEGTHGIQALDLLGRKLWLAQGRGQKLLLQRIQATLQQAQQYQDLKPLVSTYHQGLQQVLDTLLQLGSRLQQGQVDAVLGNAAVVLDVMGKVVVTWLWFEMLQQAHQVSHADDPWLRGKLQALRYMVEWELPQALAQLPPLNAANDCWTSMQSDDF